MFVESGEHDPGEVGWLNSEHLDPTPQSCFTFYYHMYGQGKKAPTANQIFHQETEIDLLHISHNASS